MPYPSTTSGSRPNPNKVAKVNTRWLASLGVKFDPAKFNPKAAKTATPANTATTTTTPSETAGADAALAALQSSLAEENAKKQGNT
jgi:RNA polymerase II elongation factor ELL